MSLMHVVTVDAHTDSCKHDGRVLECIRSSSSLLGGHMSSCCPCSVACADKSVHSQQIEEPYVHPLIIL